MWPQKKWDEASMILSHHVEKILEDEYPILYHTVQTSGLSVSTVVHQWWSQLFLNMLNWTDIVKYLLIVSHPSGRPM